MDLQTQKHLGENGMSIIDARACNGTKETESLYSVIKGMTVIPLSLFATIFFYPLWDVLPVFLCIPTLIFFQKIL